MYIFVYTLHILYISSTGLSDSRIPRPRPGAVIKMYDDEWFPGMTWCRRASRAPPGYGSYGWFINPSNYSYMDMGQYL